MLKEVAEVPQAPQERSPSSAVPVTPTHGNDVMIPERDSGKILVLKFYHVYTFKGRWSLSYLDALHNVY